MEENGPFKMDVVPRKVSDAIYVSHRLDFLREAGSRVLLFGEIACEGPTSEGLFSLLLSLVPPSDGV